MKQNLKYIICSVVFLFIGVITTILTLNHFKVFDNNTIKKVKVQIHYLKPIEYEEYKELSTNELAQLVQKRISTFIKDKGK